MSTKNSQIAQELGKFVEALWLELPIAAAERMTGRAGEEALSKAGWQAYDAFIGLTNEATNLLYASPLTGLITGRAMESSLRLQQTGSAIANAFLGNLWPALGLPTADQVAKLGAELGELRRDFNAAAEAVERESVHRAFQPSEALTLVKNGKISAIKKEDDEDAAA